VHVEVTGQGPALVMLHGWAMHSGIFAPLARRLRAHFTLHLVDLPGHGLSPERDGPLDLADCAARIAGVVPPAPWLGWSLGGLVALLAASAGHARGLIMLCATPRFVRADDWPHGVAPELFHGFARDLAADYRATLDRFLALESHGSDHARSELRSLRCHVFERGEPAPPVLVDGLALLADSDLRPLLPGLPVPSLWLAGRRDRLVDWRAMEAAAALAPRARFHRIDGGGHAPFLGHAEGVAAHVHAFGSDLPA
jgi:pimeloyl-[acyl-carrier protein] methyl ester esterase